MPQFFVRILFIRAAGERGPMCFSCREKWKCLMNMAVFCDLHQTADVTLTAHYFSILVTSSIFWNTHHQNWNEYDFCLSKTSHRSDTVEQNHTAGVNIASANFCRSYQPNQTLAYWAPFGLGFISLQQASESKKRNYAIRSINTLLII